MEDVICVSSGSDDDSDLEVISSYSENKDDAVPFIRAEWLPVTPVVIDITGHSFTPPRRRCSKRDTCSTLEVIDLSEDDPPHDVDLQRQQKKVHLTLTSHGKPQESPSQKDVSNLACFEKGDLQKTRCLDEDTDCDSRLPSERPSWDKSLEHNTSSDLNKNPFKSESELLKNSITNESHNTKDTQISSTDGDQENENVDSSSKWEGSAHSPYSLDSPYYCPSEVDAYLFSDASNKSVDINNVLTDNDRLSPDVLSLKEMNVDANEELQTLVYLKPSFDSIPTSKASPRWRPGSPGSPTSTEILASDTAALSPDLSVMSSPRSCLSLLNSQPPTPNFTETLLESPPISLWEASSDNENTLDNVETDLYENNSQERQHICLAQYRKLSQCISGADSQMHADEDEDEHYGAAEPLCRQSLSLVYSTIEENYPEGTLQLLSDFIQPRYYPPRDITTHLLRGIFLDPQSPDVLVVEAYNLLMKTQRYHPMDASTVPWDWELIKSVMKDKDDTRRLPTEVQYMFLQYVLQVLEDDFHFKLKTQCLQHSVVKKMLSSGPETFGQVKDIIKWLMNAATESVNHSKDVGHPKKEDNHLKIVLSLQRMLALALEVDKHPTYDSVKLSEELFSCFNRMCSCRQIRLLLLTTLESNLLKCKLLKLLLDEACFQKTCLPMSLSLLLHYLKSTTLAADPSDGEEKWRKWDELLQLLWMLLLSYEEVVTGRLQIPITKRFDRIHAPIWTHDDQVKGSAVRDAVDTFLSRAADDVGQSLPMEIQESLSQLQEHITDMTSVISHR